MNWYKESQIKFQDNNVTLKDITRAIDQIILKEDMITVEGLLEAEKSMRVPQEGVSKAAQSLKDFFKDKNGNLIGGRTKKILDLMYLGYPNKMISKKLNYPIDEVTKVVKDAYPSIKKKKYEIEQLHQQKILDTTKDLHKKTIKDITLGKISFERISEELGGVAIALIKQILSSNGIELSRLVEERNVAIEKMVVKTVQGMENPYSMEDIRKQFFNKYRYNIPGSTMNRIIKYKNILTDTMLVEKEGLIFAAFKSFASNKGVTVQNMSKVTQAKLDKLINQFIAKVGPDFGFVHPIDQQKLKKLFMTKIQIRNRARAQGNKNIWYKDLSIPPAVRRNMFQLIMNGSDMNTLINNFPQFDRNQVEQLYHMYKIERGPMYYEDDKINLPQNNNTKNAPVQNNPVQNNVSNKNKASASNWYKEANKWKDNIPGGKSDEMKPSDFDKNNVEKGKEIELEHTNDPSTAKEIAIDHLEEHPKYYDDKNGLPAMEKQLKKLERKK